MNILFIHKNFPGQFKYISLILANQPGNRVVFITEEDQLELKGIEKRIYKYTEEVSEDCHPYLEHFEKTVRLGRIVATEAMKLKKEGFKPDVIYGISGWGSTLFVKDIFPDVPFISYCEWFTKENSPEAAFDNTEIIDEDKPIISCGNSHLLSDLVASDLVICPTLWQKAQFPKEFQYKIQAIHEGIDTQTCHPDANAKFLIRDKNLELSLKDEVITYGTQGMELYRGFPQFMEAASIIQKKRPNAHIIIAGVDRTCYGPAPEHGTYKENALKKFKYDMNRLHFVGKLSFYDFINFLQISSAHVYATYPYILSWSMLNAMATGCCLVASNSPPVIEVVQDNYNGLLYDFFNVNQLVEKIEYALDNKEKMQEIRNNARQTIIEKYDLIKLAALQINIITSFANKAKGEQQ